MFKKLTMALAGFTLAANVATADYNMDYGVQAPTIEVTTNLHRLANLDLTIGGVFDTFSPVSVELVLDYAFNTLMRAHNHTRQYHIARPELGMRWYMNQDKMSGLFLTMHFGAEIFKRDHHINHDVKGLKAEDAAVKDAEGVLGMDIYASFGIGHKLQLADWLSVTNRLYARTDLFSTNRGSEEESKVAAEDNVSGKAVKHDQTGGAINGAHADNQLFNNVLSNIRYEIANLEFYVY